MILITLSNTRQFELEKIVMVGGNLDPSVLDEEQIAKPTALQVLLLTRSGKIYAWVQSNSVLTRSVYPFFQVFRRQFLRFNSFSRCFFRLGRPLIIKDVVMGNTSIFLVSKEGEAFNGKLIYKESASKKADASPTANQRAKDSWIEFAKREQSYQIKVQRIPNIYHAVSFACDPEERNFAVLQVMAILLTKMKRFF